MQNKTKLTLKIYWRHTMKYPWLVLVTCFFVICASLSTVTVPLYFRQLFNTLAAGMKDGAAIDNLLLTLLFIGLFLSAEFLSWRIGSWTSILLESRVMADLSRTCFNYLHKHSFTYFNNSFVGSLVKRVNWFVRAFESLCDKLIFNFIPTFTILVFAIVVLILKNLWLGLIMVGWFLIFVIANSFLTAYKLRFDIARSGAESEMTALLADTITNQSNVKLFCGYRREVSLFSSVTDKVKKLRLTAWNIDWLMHGVQGFLMLILQVGLFYFAIKLWQRGIFSIGDFVLLQTYVFLIFDRIWNLGTIIRHLYQDLADAEEMTGILDSPHEIQDVVNAKNIAVSMGEIEFKNVSFSYNKTRRIMENLNLTIGSREKLGIVGPSGGGKTTIVKLIPRMYDLAAGKILIDKQDIGKVTQESLWKNISFVPQDPILFHRTLMENIRYGRPEAKDRDVHDAAKLAYCHEFISNFPEEYDTYVGERGMKLSGGERQRVAIARAILRNTPILILDEATSSLDSESERLIQSALDNLMSDKTVIVVAHRLSTIMKMDRIIVIENGQIIEEGTHSQLLRRKDGVYKRLWNLQAGGFIQ